MLKDVLKILEDDARASTRQIATMTGTPTAEVTKLIKQAEKDRIILKYKTVINWDRVEDEQVWALIEVKVTPEPEAGFDSIAGPCGCRQIRGHGSRLRVAEPGAY